MENWTYIPSNVKLDYDTLESKGKLELTQEEFENIKNTMSPELNIICDNLKNSYQE